SDRIPLTSLTLHGARAAQSVRFRALRAVLGNGQQAAGTITGDGQFDAGKVNMSLRTERFNLKHIDERMRATRLSGSVTLQHADGRQNMVLDLSEPLDRNRLTLAARADIADNVVNVPEAALRIGNGAAVFSGSVQLDEAQSFQAEGQLQRFRLTELGDFP